MDSSFMLEHKIRPSSIIQSRVAVNMEPEAQGTRQRNAQKNAWTGGNLDTPVHPATH